MLFGTEGGGGPHSFLAVRKNGGADAEEFPGGLLPRFTEVDIMTKSLLCAWALVLVFVLGVSAPAQQVIFSEDFEKGPSTQVERIKRYPNTPEVVASDAAYPGAFPPPSGRHAARAADPTIGFHGLGSIVLGPTLDLSTPQHQYAAIEAKLFIPEITEDFGIANVALIAVNDEARTETYYRYGFGKGSVYFHHFDGNTFTESVFDPVLAAELRVPGWHTFTLRFNGPGEQYCYMDGKPTGFSPVRRTELTKVRLGVLGWDKDQGRPILADDFKVTLYSEPPQPGALGGAPTLLEKAPSPVFSFPTPQPTPAAPVVWFTDTAQALQAAAGSNKKFLVVFYLDGHPLTMQLAQETLMRPETQATLSRYVCVSLEGRTNADTVRRYGVYKFPTLLVLDTQGRVYWEYRGMISPAQLNESLGRD